MENQEIHTPAETHEAPQKPEPTTEYAMSRRGFFGAIGAITAAAATGVLTNACRRDERETGEPAVPRELSPEQAEKMIQLLKTRSEAAKNKNLCPDLDWTGAERKGHSLRRFS